MSSAYFSKTISNKLQSPILGQTEVGIYIIDKLQNSANKIDQKNYKQKIKQIFPHTQSPLSIDMKIGESGTETIADSISSSLPSSLQQAINKENVFLIEEGLDSLNKREKYIIEHRFGLHGNKKETLEEIGKKFKLTRERIRQVEKIALKKLKSFLSKKMV